MGLGMPLNRLSGSGGKSSDLTCQQAHTSKPQDSLSCTSVVLPLLIARLRSSPTMRLAG